MCGAVRYPASSHSTPLQGGVVELGRKWRAKLRRGCGPHDARPHQTTAWPGQSATMRFHNSFMGLMLSITAGTRISRNSAPIPRWPGRGIFSQGGGFVLEFHRPITRATLSFVGLWIHKSEYVDCPLNRVGDRQRPPADCKRRGRGRRAGKCLARIADAKR